MPNHCFNAKLNNPSSQDIDWSVKFDRDVKGDAFMMKKKEINSMGKSSKLLCDLQRTSSSNMIPGHGYKVISGGKRRRGPSGKDPMPTTSGIAITGAFIFNGLDGHNRDAVENEYRTLDQCLTHPSPHGDYHYHMWSPCINKGSKT